MDSGRTESPKSKSQSPKAKSRKSRMSRRHKSRKSRKTRRNSRSRMNRRNSKRNISLIPRRKSRLSHRWNKNPPASRDDEFAQSVRRFVNRRTDRTCYRDCGKYPKTCKSGTFGKEASCHHGKKCMFIKIDNGEMFKVSAKDESMNRKRKGDRNTLVVGNCE